MVAGPFPGVIKRKNQLFTQNHHQCLGKRVYGEMLKREKGVEWRSWNPYRSKLAAAILKGLNSISIESNARILYLGAATGTTVSHLSDIVTNGQIFAIEHSPIAAHKLINSLKDRENVIPILADANHPETYMHIVPKVDILYQDISQRNQSDIFIRNYQLFSKQSTQGLLMVKARSIDVSLPPKKAYTIVEQELQQAEFSLQESINLSPFEKDHAAISVNQKDQQMGL